MTLGSTQDLGAEFPWATISGDHLYRVKRRAYVRADHRETTRHRDLLPRHNAGGLLRRADRQAQGRGCPQPQTHLLGSVVAAKVAVVVPRLDFRFARLPVIQDSSQNNDAVSPQLV